MRCLNLLVIFALVLCTGVRGGVPRKEVVESVQTVEESTSDGGDKDECEHKGCDCNCNCASPVMTNQRNCIMKEVKQCAKVNEVVEGSCKTVGTERVCITATDEQCSKYVKDVKTCCMHIDGMQKCWDEDEGREMCWDEPLQECDEVPMDKCSVQPSLECNLMATQKDIEFDPGYGHTTTYGGYSGGYSRPKCINRDCECECNCLHEAIPYNFQYTGQQKNAAPIAHINPAQLKVELFSQVVLDASQSFDPEGGPLEFLWILPSVGGIDLDPDFPEKFSFVATAEGEFTISLNVTDISGATDTAEAILAVFGPPPK